MRGIDKLHEYRSVRKQVKQLLSEDNRNFW